MAIDSGWDHEDREIALEDARQCREERAAEAAHLRDEDHDSDQCKYCWEEQRAAKAHNEGRCGGPEKCDICQEEDAQRAADEELDAEFDRQESEEY